MIYTDWANHYLAKSGHKRLIKDLQQDVTDGVLLAEIIQVVANEKIEDINGCPKSRSQMPADSTATQQPGMNENVQSSAPISNSSSTSTISSSSTTTSSAIPQPNSANKPWRSKSLSAKHTATSSMLSVKQPSQEAPPKPPVEAAKTTPNGQKSMLEKLKLFNTKGGSKTAGAPLESSVSRDVGSEKAEVASNAEEPEDTEPASRGVSGTGAAANSPKIALKGIAQRTFSRALTTKKSSLKSAEKEKQKEKDKAKEISKRVSVTEKPETKEEPKEEVAGTAMSEPKKTSKIASFIPKGGKLSCAKKETSAPAHSGIPKPGAKTSATGKSAGAPSSSSSGKEGERPRSAKLGPGLSLHKGQLDSRHSSSSSSLASSEGKAIGGTPHQANSGAQAGTSCNTQTTGSNTISVQLPQPQQQYNHPNTATVAPFMYRSQTDIDGNMNTDCGSGGGNVDPVAYNKVGQPGVEDLSGEDPETRRLRTVKNIADLRQNLEETMSSLRGTQVTHRRASALPYCLPGLTSPTKPICDSTPTAGEDPETRRLRTVKNIADLRQNLEETMSSLRGTQVTHSTLETTFDSNVTTEISGRSILSLTARSTPLSWRLGQSSPRLQAGDAPSLGNRFPPRGNASRFINSESGRYMYSAPLRRQLAARGSNVCSADLADKDDLDLEGIHMEATGYMSDGDVLGKNLRTDDVSSGYLTDGGLGLYTRRLNRLPDGMAAVRETLQRNTSMGVGDADSWDDSSSVSSGISDTIDNLSTDDINTSSSISSYANTPAAPRKSIDSQLRSQEDAKEWLRSHSAGGLQESASNSPFSPGSSITSPSGTRFNFAQLASPTTAAQINLANSSVLQNQEGPLDPYGDPRFRNSSMSLDEKIRTMSRSGSFRDGFEEVHGSSLSLVSSTSSIYSTIRKLRRELDASQEKVSALTTQLSANAHLVAAFEQSLGNMTIRLQSLTITAEQKDLELNELRKTIEYLKKQNAAAQAAINGVINTPELACKDCRYTVSVVRPPAPTDCGWSGRQMLNSIVYTMLYDSSLCTVDAEAHLVAAFEQSLGNMTIRLQSLTITAEQKDLELNELRKTIEYLKKQNAAAQAAINGVINTPELACKATGNGTPQSTDLRIRRQHSSDSVSSINSATSHSSVGSNVEVDSKKKKKKNWLRSSFKQAFGKKKSPKSASSHSDIEEMTDSSLPSSPKLPRNGSTASTPLMRTSHSNSLLFSYAAHLVAAFEQSLGNMTIRLQSLTITAEQKDLELNELRKTIEYLKKQNAAAQAAINGVINTPELACKGNGTPQSTDLRIRRQHSSDSVSSINSATSHSSVGSNVEVDSKKKKKKNWLRSSFKQAFGKKKSPNISECTEGEAETVMQLRSELRDKEMKLTDIRLEALSSAHQLDQLREAMNRMQGEIEKLKTENDRLKSENQGVGSRAPSQLSISSSPRQSLGLSQHSLSLTESTSLDMLLDDNADGGTTRKEGRHVKIVVSLQNEMKWKEECRPRRFLVGCIGVSGKTKWDVLDGVVRRLFKEYIIHIDPVSQLGLNSDSVLGYSIGDIHRTTRSETPELLPCGYLVGDNNTISVTLKGVSEHSQDCLVFETLIPKPMLQRYVSLLSEHRRIILSGPSGTGKTYLANRLAEYVVLKEGRELSDGVIATFNVDHKSSKELRQYLSNLADQCNSESSAVDMPLVIILDNLHHVSSLGEIFNGLLNCKYHRCPYIIGTMNQATSSTPNLQLHHNFRWVLCANHTEPVKGFLGRFLRRKLIETEISSRMRNTELLKVIDWIPKVWQHLNKFLEAHSSSDVTIVDVAGSRVWFTDLWNYSIIPYMLEAVREGLQLYGRRAAWEDPAKWVMDTYPWAASPQQHEWPPLLQLRPEDVGFDGYTVVREGCSSKQVPQSDTEGDPLMNMLMRLQEAANYSSPQSYDSDSNSNSHHDDILDSSLESTL
ncbi:UNVERIFIED_CONTAM: hypothetical protein FKN15_043143 [Acipenser sinensis]